MRGIAGKREPQMKMVLGILEMLRRIGPRLGPYLVLEIVMPGGTLMALLLFLYRRRSMVPAPAFAGAASWPCRMRAVPIDYSAKGRE